MHQLTSVDMQFLAAEDGRVHGHVTGLAIYDPVSTGRALTAADVREVITGRLHLIPPFRRRIVRVPFDLDLPYWVEDPNFDVANHVHAHTVDDSGGDRELADLVGRLMSRPLDLDRPPWAVHVIEGLAGGRVAVATQIHHAASDGLAMAELFATLHDPTPDVRDLSGEAVGPGRIPSRLEMLGRGVAGIPRQPIRFARSLPRALPHLDEVVTLRPIPGVTRAASIGRRASRLTSRGDGGILEAPVRLAPRTRTTGMISGERTVAFMSTPLADIKAVKNHFGVTVNDVVTTIAAGALRQWLADHDDLPDKPLAAMVPVSVRTSEQNGSYGNRITMMIPPIFTDEPDPVVRLRRTHEAMRSVKERHKAVPATLLQDANHFIPPVLLARAAQASALVASSPRRGAAANVLISNIPGARDAQYLAGARLTAHFPLSAIFHGLGLNITVVSYGDQVDWGIVGDPAQIGTAWGLAEQINASQAELHALTRG